MNKEKIYRIITANGLKKENFDSVSENGDIFVTEDGVLYKLNGFNKAIVSNSLEVSSNNKTNKIEPSKDKHRSEDEIDRIMNIKKPRGWHFSNKYIDDEGNIFIKGKLQD